MRNPNLCGYFFPGERKNGSGERKGERKRMDNGNSSASLALFHRLGKKQRAEISFKYQPIYQNIPLFP